MIGGIKPSVLPTPDEIHTLYNQREAMVRVLFEAQARLIRALEGKILNLRDPLKPGNSLGGTRRNRYPWPITAQKGKPQR
jgi:hypothetical protein